MTKLSIQEQLERQLASARRRNSELEDRNDSLNHMFDAMYDKWKKTQWELDDLREATKQGKREDQ